ncbi:unnamed protein product [Lampetra fluviatilis]
MATGGNESWTAESGLQNAVIISSVRKLVKSANLRDHETRRRLEDEHEKHVCCGVIYPYNDNAAEALIAFTSAQDMDVFINRKTYPTRKYSEEKLKYSRSNLENPGNQAKSTSGHSTLEDMKSMEPLQYTMTSQVATKGQSTHILGSLIMERQGQHIYLIRSRGGMYSASSGGHLIRG